MEVSKLSNNFKPNLVLKSEIIRQGFNLKTFCVEVGINESGFNRRINGKVPFREDEMYLIANKLNKPVDEIFFDKHVAKTATRNRIKKRA
jgi:hypothetical protein